MSTNRDKKIDEKIETIQQEFLKGHLTHDDAVVFMQAQYELMTPLHRALWLDDLLNKLKELS